MTHQPHSPMKLFHLIVATPIEAQPHELHRVLYSDYIVEALGLQAAYDAISGHTAPVDVAMAPEVWGRALEPRKDGVVVSPDTKLQSQVDIGQHRHWASVQDRYTLVHQGPESFQKWIDQKFQEYWDKNHPAAAKTDGAGVQGTGGAGDSTSLVEPASV